MQGTYKNNGLPRPYYMKPSTKKKFQSPYDKMPRTFFTTPMRKIIGYILMLSLFGVIMYWVAQDMRPTPDPEYEVIAPELLRNNPIPQVNKPQENFDNMVKIGKNADGEIDNVDLAGNMAQGSNGEIGLGVAEAPKGGIANEGAVVGAEKELDKPRNPKAVGNEIPEKPNKGER
ncbi:hypothetical protein PGUG_00469 [Meyerozyma guilliermondii ATCC 6260]|uniref:Uncharacterized protein n=1 Tax=Meyerozyma guilliermondii (strain ATCC 6260 / CBS 566 / DSM 6381 / JCM 1539 / NBRC 10279 / NRRL Y-324) TaxID=294746 RepID=A5DB14_PICGU|nr:uncharacterized protein PGUG_00469 [Meyerozyma guilliermondii ATCC 6260]EDK36370.2 hypothetical protein PGUG_00469 [Meyerozyma guilliermondii ATCC 6260]